MFREWIFCKAFSSGCFRWIWSFRNKNHNNKTGFLFARECLSQYFKWNNGQMGFVKSAQSIVSLVSLRRQIKKWYLERAMPGCAPPPSWCAFSFCAFCIVPSILPFESICSGVWWAEPSRTTGLLWVPLFQTTRPDLIEFLSRYANDMCFWIRRNKKFWDFRDFLYFLRHGFDFDLIIFPMWSSPPPRTPRPCVGHTSCGSRAVDRFTALELRCNDSWRLYSWSLLRCALCSLLWRIRI